MAKISSKRGHDSAIYELVSDIMLSIVCIGTYFIDCELNFISLFFMETLNIPHIHLGIYNSKLTCFRSIFIILGCLTEYGIYKICNKFNLEEKHPKYREGLSVFFLFALCVVRIILTLILYFSKQLPLHLYIILNVEAFYFGIFQTSFISLAMDHSGDIKFVNYILSGTMKFIQFRITTSETNKPMFFLKINFFICIGISIISLIMWPVYLFRFHKPLYQYDEYLFFVKTRINQIISDSDNSGEILNDVKKKMEEIDIPELDEINKIGKEIGSTTEEKDSNNEKDSDTIENEDTEKNKNGGGTGSTTRDEHSENDSDSTLSESGETDGADEETGSENEEDSENDSQSDISDHIETDDDEEPDEEITSTLGRDDSDRYNSTNKDENGESIETDDTDETDSTIEYGDSKKDNHSNESENSESEDEDNNENLQNEKDSDTIENEDTEKNKNGGGTGSTGEHEDSENKTNISKDNDDINDEIGSTTEKQDLNTFDISNKTKNNEMGEDNKLIAELFALLNKMDYSKMYYASTQIMNKNYEMHFNSLKHKEFHDLLMRETDSLLDFGGKIKSLQSIVNRERKQLPWDSRQIKYKLNYLKEETNKALVEIKKLSQASKFLNDQIKKIANKNLKWALSALLMIIPTIIIFYFLFDGVLPHAIIIDEESKHIIVLTSVALFVGSMPPVVLTSKKHDYRYWTWEISCFWLALIPQIAVLVSAILAIHSKISYFKFIIDVPFIVATMCSILGICHGLMESTSFISVTNHVYFHSVDPDDFYLVIIQIVLRIYLKYISLKLSACYNEARISLGFFRPDFYTFLEVGSLEAFLITMKETFRRFFFDLFFDIRVNINQFI